MAFVEPSKGRARITDLGSEVRIEIPLRPRNLREWLQWCVLTWVLIMGVVGAKVILDAAARYPQMLGFAGVVWVVGVAASFVVGMVALLMQWLRLSFGRQVIAVASDGLTIVTLPLGRPRKYRLAEVRNLRVREPRHSREPHHFRVWRPSIAFDYGAKTVRCGFLLDPAEAQQIVGLIKERFGDRMAPDEKGD